MINIECTKSLELLSDYHDGFLDDNDKNLVETHLAKCPPCVGIFKDLNTITVLASEIRTTKISFPDENEIWHRMKLSQRTVH
jgi:predicted anti-sigma-YlaC factor YlaD